MFPELENNTFFALDVGSTFTGVTIVKNKNVEKIVELIVNEPVTYRKSLAVSSRIISFIQENTNSYYYLLIEDYAYGGGFFNAVQAETMGAIKKHCLDDPKALGVISIPVGTIKKQVTGSGRATKSQVVKALKIEGNFTTASKDGHKADSLAVYKTYEALISSDTPQTDKLRSVLWDNKNK